MLNNLAKKLKFRRTRCRTHRQSDDKTNVENTENSSVINEEHFANGNLSILTDTQPESNDVVDNVYPREERNADRRMTNSSSSSSQDSYIVISTEEIPVQSKDENWEYVTHRDIVEIAQSQDQAKVKKYCSSRRGTAWLLKIRRDILRNCGNKVYPLTAKE